LPHDVILLLPAAIVITAASAMASGATADDRSLRGELSRLAERRVFFAHQSVGQGLVDGLRTLAAREGVDVRVVETAGPPSSPAFAHGLVGRNGDPFGKLASFERLLEAGEVDIALMKFCYVDFTSTSDVDGLFAEYRTTLARLRARHPRTAFVHVTVPLTTVQRGSRALLKRLAGRPPGGVLENARRERFNELLRAAYAGKEPLFDLAREEATRDDGTLERAAWGNVSALALYAGHTDDGYHLAGAAQVRIARRLVAVLAALP
jgi:hypothetical protein